MSRRRQSGWKGSELPPHAWRTPYPNSRTENQLAQDAAAGGRANRRIHLPDGTHALGRVRFAAKSARRVYAYLAWNHDGHRHELFLGEATQRTREANLTTAWTLINAHALQNPQRRQSWHTHHPDSQDKP